MTFNIGAAILIAAAPFAIICVGLLAVERSMKNQGALKPGLLVMILGVAVWNGLAIWEVIRLTR